ncbi:hypothetical protein AURANDRAFT_61514 [Aureococcus anophagefferens]|uniref:PDZ domain-containing protein n=1 Tax=Aureococcus anophagefferens TaxID=44056 RepID=F0Y0C3_AURAN|nr:hypothetical protein AURANDRAFT_61514 [Aureococcus anophagefferens]EGB11195.1 hypothetical protein AURANDRAFT_61514 [Aureococcus anophagefferens]|eukprot:XP_009033588.1 hypothetical protein AURANDRAFT_61514 [Aureococcus anophagefferens]
MWCMSALAILMQRYTSTGELIAIDDLIIDEDRDVNARYRAIRYATAAVLYLDVHSTAMLASKNEYSDQNVIKHRLWRVADFVLQACVHVVFRTVVIDWAIEELLAYHRSWNTDRLSFWQDLSIVPPRSSHKGARAYGDREADVEKYSGRACAAQELQRTSVFAILNAPLQPGEVRHRIAVRGDGNRVVAHLELSGAEEVADAAYAFGVANGVDRGSTRRLAAAVCGGQGLTAGEPAPPCGREAALLYENAVADPRDETGADALDGLLRIWEGQDALDAVHGFLLFELDLWFGDWFPPALVEALCGALAHPLWPCGEAPVARTVPINMGAETGKVGDLVLREDEEAADAIALFAKDREEITAHAKKQLYASVCGGNEKRKYRCTRERALLFRGGPARNGNGTMILASDGSPAFVEVWDGDEPADAAFAWSRVHAAVDVDDARHLVQDLCGAYPVKVLARSPDPPLACGRLKWVVDVMPIRGPFGPGGRQALVGNLEITDGAEAHDLAWHFSKDKGCEGCPFYKQLAANLCENPLVSCTRNKAVVWTALVDVATLETLGWPPPYGNVHLEVYEGGAVVDAVRELWFSRNESEGLFGPDARLLRRSLTALACSPDYGLAPETLCARAEEILASADVERPGAAKTMVFNYTTPRAFDDRPCGDAVDRRRAYDEQVVVRDVACAPKEEKRGHGFKSKRRRPPGSKRRDDDDDDDGDDALTRMKKRRDRDRKERGLPPIDDATSRTAAPPDDDGDGGDDANATNATAPAPAPNATTPWCASATQRLVDLNVTAIDAAVADACAATIFDFGIEGWGGPGFMQALGARNDSEADRRGVQQGMKLRKVDGVAVRDQDTVRAALRAKAVAARANGTRVAAELEFLVVNDQDRFLQKGGPDDKGGPVIVYEGMTASDAVYAACLPNELIQPNYTKLGVQRRFLAELCRPQHRVPLRGPPAPGCEDLNATTGAPIYAPRFLLFEMPLQFGGMTHTFRYYPDDWPPCPGEYNPTAWSVPDTTLHWPFGADEATLEALSLALGGEDPLPKLTNASCAPAIERFAASVCDALGPPRPPGCDVDLLNIAKQYLQQAMEHRWFEKATPDGVDLYLALGAPRDSDNDTIVDSYRRVASELGAPLELFETLLKGAQRLRERAAALRAAARALLESANATATACAEFNHWFGWS